MYKKSSYAVATAILFVSMSCKSEVKPVEVEAHVKTEVEIDNKAKENLSSPSTTKVEIQTTKDPVSNTTPKSESKVLPTPPPKKTSKPEQKNNASANTDINNSSSSVQVVQDKAVPSTIPTKDNTTTKPVEEVPTGTVAEQVKPEKSPVVEMPMGTPSHKILDGLLQTFVSSAGEVNYTGLKSKEAQLDSYLKVLESAKIDKTWSKNDKLAYWINAYNAYTLKLIVKNLPVKSITDLHGGKPWDHKWINLDGETLSLNNIENDIIRPQFNEPRIHFAVNCAAKSCPPLLNSAYKAGSLNDQLESQTKKFINNTSFNTLGAGEVKVSKIFEWYGSDFGNIAEYLSKYARSVRPNAKVTFKEYDWALNGK